MKDRAPIVVLADDLTGAAEIAAAGFVRGLEATVATGPATGPVEAPLVVHDSDTRLLQPDDATRRIMSIGARCSMAAAVARGALLFKKTDSVLRGPVLAELEALSAVSRLPRVLLVPANPRLERVIRDGRYFVSGLPIHESHFGRDPHHPARSARVVDLLGPPRRGEVRVARPGDALPDAGVIVGEAETAADLARWAGCIDARTLAAGSSAFFEAVLEARGLVRRPPVETPGGGGGVLIVSGSTAGKIREHLARASGITALPMPDACALPADPASRKAAGHWTSALLGALAGRGCAVALAPATTFADSAAPARIRTAFATMVAELHEVRAFSHLVIEGGATAAALVHRLHWNALDLVGELAPGVATLRPRGEAGCHITLKPGSYPWPASWWENLAQLAPPAA